jgi:UDP-N-acetylmuramoylalanine--D-glutamate ligase
MLQRSNRVFQHCLRVLEKDVFLVKFADLKKQSVLILGLGQEGLSTYRFLRQMFPCQHFGLADRADHDALSPQAKGVLTRNLDTQSVYLGGAYLECLSRYDVIIKSPGIPPTLPVLQQAEALGKIITSQTALFFANCSGTIIGITGTKGKSTTASLIHAILSAGGLDVRLVGNIGNPPLDIFFETNSKTVFVYELSSHQLEGLRQSPHIAVFLNMMPDHLDYYESFEDYFQAKQNIARYQSEQDYLIYNAESELVSQTATASRARLIPFSSDKMLDTGCFIANDWVSFRGKEDMEDMLEQILRIADVPLPGHFNLQNILAAVATSSLFEVESKHIVSAIRNFQPLEHRFELVGPYRGISFYNASIATVPEATIAHLDTLGSEVQTLLLGGHERHLDFSELARRLMASQVDNLILFPTNGPRIWETIRSQQTEEPTFSPRVFFVDSMEDAVRLAYAHTEPGRICLHSPASPSFGLFKDYKERGTLFKDYVRQLGE